MNKKLYPFIFAFTGIALYALLTLGLENYNFAQYSVGDYLPKNNASNRSHADAVEKPAQYRIIEWEELLPKGWDLTTKFSELDFSKFEDSDPRAMDALEKLRKTWDEAPIEPSLNGKSIQISGFKIPLERNAGKISEFLLAPYFGACIHAPPPPANQLIYVIATTPFEDADMTDDITVSGIIYTKSLGSEMGRSGYAMQGSIIKPYTKTKKAQLFLNIGGMVQSIPRSHP